MFEQFEIGDAGGLDTVTVLLRDCGTGRGELIVTCCNEVWLASCSAMGAKTLAQFLMVVGTDYLVDCLKRPRDSQLYDDAYLQKISRMLRSELLRRASADMRPEKSTWRVESDNDTAADAAGSSARWVVTDGVRNFKCDEKSVAHWLCVTLRSATPAAVKIPDFDIKSFS